VTKQTTCRTAEKGKTWLDDSIDWSLRKDKKEKSNKEQKKIIIN
jgi:hypothetical protein